MIKKLYYSFLSLLLLTAITHCFADSTDNVPNLKDLMDSKTKTEAQITPVTTSVPPVTTPSKQKTPLVPPPHDEYDRGTPRSSIEGYFHSVGNNDWGTASHYLDLRKIKKSHREKEGKNLAKKLQIILTSKLWIDSKKLSADPAGEKNDGLPSYQERVGSIKLNDKNIEILLQRVPSEKNIYIWKFSAQTIKHIPKLYSVYGYGSIGTKLANYFPDTLIFGMELWQWILLLVLIIVILLMLYPITRVLAWLIEHTSQSPLAQLLASLIRGPLYLISAIFILRYNFDLIHPTLAVRALFEAQTLLVFASIWMIISIVGLFRQYWIKKLKDQGHELAAFILRPITTAINIIIVFLGVLVWLDNIGFSVTTVLTGLGIGGLALALATQKSIEDFIGSVTLYLAAPVKVGDFCRFDHQSGTVEEIGLRATKIRTLEDTVITIPNSNFSSTHIENVTQRTRYRFYHKIPLHISTSADQIRFIILEFKKLLYAYIRVAESPLRVNFIGIEEHAFIIEIHCYIETTEVAVFKNISEDINLHFMDIIKQSGTSIAIPSNIEYKENIPDTEAKIATEKNIAESKVDGKISLEFSEEEKNTIKDSISYPTINNKI